MAKLHKPGPWVLDEDAAVIYDTHGRTVLNDAEEMTAIEDLRIMAAAPELLGCCRNALAFVNKLRMRDLGNRELKMLADDLDRAIAAAEHGKRPGDGLPW